MNRYWQVTMEDAAQANPLVSGVSGLYNAHFGLHATPFSLTPDTQFFYDHPSMREALNTLVLAVRSGEGFTKVVSEIGTGKTLLCRTFLALLRDQFVTAYVPNPYMEPMTLLLAVADELGVKYAPDVNQHQILKLLTNFLIDTFARQQRTVVVCLDEAHAMPLESLEALRLLSNLETEKRKLLQIVLFGQPELDVKLREPSIRQLRQRIAFSCHLRPMTRNELTRYVSHRLTVAGRGEDELFTRRALRVLFVASGGVPRLVNILAHKALASAYGEGAQRVRARHVRLAVFDTESTSSVFRRRLWTRRLLATGMAGAALAAGVFGSMI